MEMNTRIQVEHPVTEMITNVDLIKEMISVSEGNPLSFTQEDLSIDGWSIECRINAEDSERDSSFPGQDRFLSASGRYRRSRGQLGLSRLYDLPSLRFHDRQADRVGTYT